MKSKLVSVARISFRYIIVAIGLPIFMNCSPNIESGQSISRKTTFANYSSTVAAVEAPPAPPESSFVSQKVELGVQPVAQCVAGEMDMLRYAHQCATQVPLLITMMDATGEKIVVRRNAYRNISFNQLLLEMTTHQMGQILGNEVDVLVCIDANGNGLCSDESVQNINNISAKLAPVMKAANTTGVLTCDAGLTQMLTAGVVLYHRHHQFRGVQSDHSRAVSALMKSQVKSLSANDVAVAADGSTRLNLQMVQFDQTTCPPPPAVRTDGCFARDTKIKTSTRGEVAIDLLMPNEALALADGRSAKIKRIVAGPEKLPLVVFETVSGQKIRVTSTHPMQTDKGIKGAEDISIGDQLKLENGSFVALKKVTRQAYSDQVYNVELEGSQEADHLVIANGLVSGDLYLQNNLPKAKRGIASVKD